MIGSGLRDSRQQQVIWLAEIDSTNTEALRRASAGETNIWICAERQTAGRGRSGRQWISERGNLFASYVFKPGCDPSDLPQLSLLAGLAARDAVLKLAQGKLAADEPRLKWPNDILLNGAKIAGVLIECQSVAAADAPSDVVIGTGINLASHPEIVNYPTTALAYHGIEVRAAGVHRALQAATQHWLEVWSNGDGFFKIRKKWLQHAAPFGHGDQFAFWQRGAFGSFCRSRSWWSIVIGRCQWQSPESDCG